MKIDSTSRPILSFRRLRIDRGVEQPGSSSVKPHIAKNKLVFDTCTATVQHAGPVGTIQASDDFQWRRQTGRRKLRGFVTVQNCWRIRRSMKRVKSAVSL
jgi:hypothetical protein